MHATRRLCSLGGGPFGFRPGELPRLLPRPSLGEIAWSALEGAWACFFDQASRNSYEKMVNDQVIKDTVLNNATNGSMLTYALFHNLHSNHLLAKYKFDAKEFVDAVGPALENFHDTMAILRNKLGENLEQATKELTEESKAKSEQEASQNSDAEKDVVSLDNMLKDVSSVDSILKSNDSWRKEAENDPDSPAAILSKMATREMLDVFYLTTVFDYLNPVIPRMEYVEGSCSVNGVALLSARAMEIRDDKDFGEYEEFRATEELGKELPVGAQMDVLFEVSQKVKANAPTSSEGDDEAKDDNDDASKTYPTTRLAVAVLEGWLHGGPSKELRWKVSDLREPYEFPDYYRHM